MKIEIRTAFFSGHLFCMHTPPPPHMSPLSYMLPCHACPPCHACLACHACPLPYVPPQCRPTCHTHPLLCMPPSHIHPQPHMSPCHAGPLLHTPLPHMPPATQVPLWMEWPTHAFETLPSSKLRLRAVNIDSKYFNLLTTNWGHSHPKCM